MSAELVPHKETEMVLSQSETMLSSIARIISDPHLDPEKMSKLLDVHERIIADQRKTAFFAAMARLTPKLPEIGKMGMSHHGKYSRLVDIDRAIRPIIAEEGFALSFDSQPSDSKVRIICRLSHEAGHSETKQIDLPLDNSGSKNGAQAVISTVNYGRRALITMFFNLIGAEDDTDGNNPEPIGQEEILNLKALIEEVKADLPRFLQFMRVNDLAEILASDYKKAVNALEAKRKR